MTDTHAPVVPTCPANPTHGAMIRRVDQPQPNDYTRHHAFECAVAGCRTAIICATRHTNAEVRARCAGVSGKHYIYRAGLPATRLHPPRGSKPRYRRVDAPAIACNCPPPVRPIVDAEVLEQRKAADLVRSLTGDPYLQYRREQINGQPPADARCTMCGRSGADIFDDADSAPFHCAGCGRTNVGEAERSDGYVAQEQILQQQQSGSAAGVTMTCDTCGAIATDVQPDDADGVRRAICGRCLARRRSRAMRVADAAPVVDRTAQLGALLEELAGYHPIASLLPSVQSTMGAA